MRVVGPWADMMRGQEGPDPLPGKKHKLSHSGNSGKGWSNKQWRRLLKKERNSLKTATRPKRLQRGFVLLENVILLKKQTNKKHEWTAWTQVVFFLMYYRAVQQSSTYIGLILTLMYLKLCYPGKYNDSDRDSVLYHSDEGQKNLIRTSLFYTHLFPVFPLCVWQHLQK